MAALCLLSGVGCDALTFSPDGEAPVTDLDPATGELTIDLVPGSDTLG